MSFSRFTNTLLRAACALFLCCQAHANLLTNGSFESGTFTNQGNETEVFNAGATTITGWTVVGRQIAWINVGSPWGIPPEDGNLFLDLTSYNPGAPFGGATQSIATTVGQQYILAGAPGSTLTLSKPM